MNIQTISEYIKLFNTEIIASGFKRDLQDNVTSLPNNQSNINSLRDSANKVFEFLSNLYSSDFLENMNYLFPDKATIPFTESNSFNQLSELLDDKEIAQPKFFQKLHQIFTALNQQIDQNIVKVKIIEKFILPYLTQENNNIAEENKAIISIIFKEKKTVSNLKHFTKNIQMWNRRLPIYHQIIKSSSPEDIEILEVQNGSIDFVLNFDIDVALSLVDLFKEGFKYYLAYLSYKKMTNPIAQTFFGNKLLIKKQKEIEDELLGNIEVAISEKIKGQHKQALKKDKNIDTNIDLKVEQITKLVTVHIINGNDVKLLSLPEQEEEIEEENELLISNLRKVSADVRRSLKALPENEMMKLLEKYGTIEDNK